MASREPRSSLPPAFSFTPMGRAVLDALNEGVVVFDAYGRMLFANQRAREALGGWSGPAAEGAAALRARLSELGGQSSLLKAGAMILGEAVFLTGGKQARTLEERERHAILETLDLTGGRLAEAARRLGISRTTLWRRLKAYGVELNERVRRHEAT